MNARLLVVLEGRGYNFSLWLRSAILSYLISSYRPGGGPFLPRARLQTHPAYYHQTFSVPTRLHSCYTKLDSHRVHIYITD